MLADYFWEPTDCEIKNRKVHWERLNKTGRINLSAFLVVSWSESGPPADQDAVS